MEESPESSVETSVSYLIFMFGVGFGIIGVLIYAGFNSWNVWLTLLLGAVVQLVFRVTKRLWRNSLSPSDESSSEKSEREWTKTDVRNLLIAYPTMVVVCALWYGIGWGVHWMIN